MWRITVWGNVKEMVTEFLGETFTPRGALIMIDHLLEAGGSREEHQILTEWLHVACMEDGKVAIQRAQNPTVPLSDEELVKCQLQVANQDLPPWNTPTTRNTEPLETTQAPWDVWE
jgi:hypothetical protein